MFIGLPGSGKSTLAHKIGCVVYEADMFFMREGVYQYDVKLINEAHELCFSNFKQCVYDNIDVAEANTFITRWERKKYLEFAQKYNCNIHLMEVKTEYGSVHNVPDNVIDRMRRKYQPFDPNELWNYEATHKIID